MDLSVSYIPLMELHVPAAEAPQPEGLHGVSARVSETTVVQDDVGLPQRIWFIVTITLRCGIKMNDVDLGLNQEFFCF